jgi:ferredoxin
MTISYDTNSCIRNAYFHNHCSNCVEICPETVFSIFQNRIVLDTKLCTLCNACLGVCPTESLEIPTFDPNRFVLEFETSENRVLSCKDNTTCLSAFDTHHFEILKMQEGGVSLDLSHCDTCEIGSVLESIKSRVPEGVETLFEKREENQKRKLFGKLLKREKPVVEAKLKKPNFAKRFFPLKQHLLVEKSKELEVVPGILGTQKISNSCTNCGDCIQFCPTEALFYSSDKLDIFISSEKCISCGICQHICKVDAVSSDEVSILDLLKPKHLINFEMATCTECKTPFIKRDESEICERCIDFTTNFSHMFTLARDV